MPLIDCPECGRQISTAAEACPQCGHPNRPESKPYSGPSCYKCSTTATTRCQSCGALSCALHVNSIYVSHGKGGAYELRCESCYASAQMWRVVGWVFAAIILVIVFLVFMNMQR
jgi:hypothetical protein